MIQRLLAAFFLTECRAFLCALTAAALFLGAGLLLSLNQPPAAPAFCTCAAVVVFIITFIYEKPNRPR